MIVIIFKFYIIKLFLKTIVTSLIMNWGRWGLCELTLAEAFTSIILLAHVT